MPTTKLSKTSSRMTVLLARMKLSWSYPVVVGLLLSACATSKPPPPPVVLRSTGRDGELVRQVPVVDIHTHTFNSRFLPIQNIALAKRERHWALVLLRPPIVNRVAERITKLTKLDYLSADPAARRERVIEAAEANELSTEVVESPTTVTEADLQNDPTVTGVEKIAKGRPAQELSDAELKGLERVVSLFATEKQAPVAKEKRKSEIGHFLRCMLASDHALVDRFYTDHGKNVQLMVSHMMDLAPVFNQKEDGTRLLPFREQVRRFKKQQDNARGRMLYFVAYNPFRDHYRGGRPGDALAIVKKAYEEQGAFGVKVYPPAGYTPFDNKIPNRPTFLRQPRKQWEARYKPNGVLLEKEELDARLLDLFSWAVENDVPLFVHIGDNEVQASTGYYKMADPARWLELLDKHEKLKNIRICFAHAGDGEYWFGKGGKGWGEDVFKLCAKYPNIYCEFGVHDSIVDPDKRENFKARLAQLIEQSRADSESFDFSTKILYGSDWYMPMMAGRDRVNYLNAHKEAILNVPLKQSEGGSHSGDTESLYKNYFYRNAIAFLNAKKQLNREGIPASLRAKLGHLVQLAGTEDSGSRMRGAWAKIRALTEPGQRRSQEDLVSFAR